MPESARREAVGHQKRKRCLIVERHEWETGFAQEQLQIPLAAATSFFGPGTSRRNIRVRIPGGRQIYPCSVSRTHAASHTRRINGLPIVGLLGSCFVFFQEVDEPDLFELWCQYDVPIVVARCTNWQQGRSSQHGRGRLVNIVDAPVERPIARI
jgi:hypothetical protein